MQIIAFAWFENMSSHVRAYQPMLELQARRGHMIEICQHPADLTPTDAVLDEIAATFDVAYISRYHEPAAQELARRLRAVGVPVVWDHDDDQLAVSRTRDDARSRELTAGIPSMLRLADVVTTTNDRLADLYLEEGARHVVTIPNHLAHTWTYARSRPHDGIVLGYIGWADHKRDWEALGLEAIVRELLDEHPDLRVEVVGPLDLELPEDRCSRFGTVLGEIIAYQDLPPYLASFDIGLAPLRDSEFNRSRSDIKLKEYAIMSVPWLASAVGPYLDHGEDQGGRLVEDDEWYEQIDDLIRDKRARRKLAKRGQKWATGHMLAGNVDLWEDALLEAIEIVGERNAA